MKIRKKVLHVLGQLNIGGIESWLVDFINKTSQDYEYHIIVDRPEKGYYEQHLIDLGCKTYHISSPKNKLSYIKDLYATIKIINPDICHSHVSFTNGIVSLVARVCGVNKVISYSHSDRSNFYKNKGLARKALINIQILLTRLFSNYKTAVSRESALCHYKKVNGVSIIPCGKDFSDLVRIEEKLDRKEFGFQENDFVLVNVGRLTAVKNQSFLINLLPQLDAKYKLLIVGDGNLYKELMILVTEMNVEHRVFFAGASKDVLRILRDAADLFLFPSHNEGLGLAAIEAQAAGLPVIASSSIPDEVCLTNDYYSIDVSNPSLWIEKIQTLCNKKMQKSVNYDICSGRYSISNNIRSVIEIYNA
ncbi:glycosyltransferase [Buttiauxella izardii]|uniref:Glycosyltransferase n=1 Tax=Buttiauxella izardii TaxID=82991 RepID=A0A3A5JTB1_9ENTR|nr:glycosyltransferase [Buttiauxella izardii]RJT25973.1 glycosyltransferase [Buttiauxella izardii]